MSRERLLRELGLGPVWRLRSPAKNAPPAAVGQPALPAVPAAASCPASPVVPAIASQTASTVMPALDAAAAQQLPPLVGDALVSAAGHTMADAVTDAPMQPPASATPRSLAGESGVSVDTPVASSDERAAAIAAMDWDELRAATNACRACPLGAQRKQAVLGVGDVKADWLFVGEGPGAEEDERGEPFVGQGGQLLDAMLAAIGLRRGEDVYIANTVKCRPPGNRTPEPAEIAACGPFLARQIALIQPKLIVALGRPAAQKLLATDEVKIGASRGRLFAHQGIPVIVTYHPAYLLRNLADKAKAWEDLCFMRKTMRELKAGG